MPLHRGCHSHNLERDTQHYFERFSEDDNFDGVTLQELPELDKLIELEDKEETKLVAQLIQRSHRAYENSMYLNLYENHFGYIKNLSMYSKSYCCSKCDELWKSATALNLLFIWKYERNHQAISGQ